MGRPELLAVAWGVPLESIERYVLQWDMEDPNNESSVITRPGKAYPTDKFEYGDYNQLFDFLEKLHYLDSSHLLFDLRIPEVTHSRKRHFVEDLSTDEMKKRCAKIK